MLLLGPSVLDLQVSQNDVSNWRIGKIQTILVGIVTTFEGTPMIARLSLALVLLLGWAGLAHANGSDLVSGAQARLATQAILACGGSGDDKKDPP